MLRHSHACPKLRSMRNTNIAVATTKQNDGFKEFVIPASI